MALGDAEKGGDAQFLRVVGDVRVVGDQREVGAAARDFPLDEMRVPFSLEISFLLLLFFHLFEINGLKLHHKFTIINWRVLLIDRIPIRACRAWTYGVPNERK